MRGQSWNCCSLIWNPAGKAAGVGVRGGSGDPSQDCASIPAFLTSAIFAGAFSMGFFKLQYCVSTEMLFWSGAGWVFTLLLSGLWGRGSWCAKTRAGLWEAAGLGSAGSEAGIDTNVTFPACSTPPTAPPTLFAGAKCKHLLGGVWRLCCRWLHGFCLMFSLNTNLGASVASSGWG